MLNFKFGTMSRDDAERSMRLFAKEVLPRLHDLEPKLHGASAPVTANV